MSVLLRQRILDLAAAGGCVSVPQIAAALGVSARTVQRARRRLVELGVLVLEPCGGRAPLAMRVTGDSATPLAPMSPVRPVSPVTPLSPMSPVAGRPCHPSLSPIMTGDTGRNLAPMLAEMCASREDERAYVQELARTRVPVGRKEPSDQLSFLPSETRATPPATPLAPVTPVAPEAACVPRVPRAMLGPVVMEGDVVRARFLRTPPAAARAALVADGWVLVRLGDEVWWLRDAEDATWASLEALVRGYRRPAPPPPPQPVQPELPTDDVGELVELQPRAAAVVLDWAEVAAVLRRRIGGAYDDAFADVAPSYDARTNVLTVAAPDDRAALVIERTYRDQVELTARAVSGRDLRVRVTTTGALRHMSMRSA